MVIKKKHIIIQARTSSSRFPNKVVQKIGDETLLGLLIKRVKKAQKIDKVIVATSTNPSDDFVEEIAIKSKVKTYRGSLEDVLDRYYQAALKNKADIIIRITGDCPLIDPELIDTLVDEFEGSELDYLSNTLDPMYPDGQDIEIFSFEALEKVCEKADLNSEREHVTPYMYQNSSYYGRSLFKADNFDNLSGDYSDIRMTVDYESDLKIIQLLVEYGGTDLSWKSYSDIYSSKQLGLLNNQIKRNEGYIKSLENDK